MHTHTYAGCTRYTRCPGCTPHATQALLEGREEARAREAQLEALADRLAEEREELREELHAANAMLSDAMANLMLTRQREAQLHAAVRHLTREAMRRENAEAAQEAPAAAVSGVAAAGGAFDLSKTRAAIEQARVTVT